MEKERLAKCEKQLKVINESKPQHLSHKQLKKALKDQCEKCVEDAKKNLELIEKLKNRGRLRLLHQS